MPVINRKVLNQEPVKYRSECAERMSYYYNSCGWRNLRKEYIMQNPLCECCLENGIVTPAVDVHHKVPWDSGLTEESKWLLLLNVDNLQSLCKHCHYKIHAEMNKKKWH